MQNSRAFLAIACMTVFSSHANAMSVSPTQIEMLSAGKAGQSRITVVNTSAQPLPVEAVITRAAIDENGSAKTTVAGDEFLVLPPQAIIAPGAAQVFRVQWLGEPLLAASESFYLHFHQIPLKLKTATLGLVQIVFSLGVMINVAPPQGQGALTVVGTGVSVDKAGNRHPTVTVENASNVHALLPQSTIQISGGGWSETLTPGMLSQTVGIGIVQPGKRRKFILPGNIPPGVASVQASVDYRPKR